MALLAPQRGIKLTPIDFGSPADAFTLPFAGAAVTVGRQARFNIARDVAGVSRRHAELRCVEVDAQHGGVAARALALGAQLLDRLLRAEVYARV